MSILTAQQLREQLEDAFPLNASHWGEATSEVRDLCCWARGYAGLGDEHAINFYALKTPSEYNTQGINGIIRFYEQMTDERKVEYVNENKHLWLDGNENE